jgi:hypothetical protein
MALSHSAFASLQDARINRRAALLGLVHGVRSNRVPPLLRSLQEPPQIDLQNFWRLRGKKKNAG